MNSLKYVSFLITRGEYATHAKKLDSRLPHWGSGDPFSEWNPWRAGCVDDGCIHIETGTVGLMWNPSSKGHKTLRQAFPELFPELRAVGDVGDVIVDLEF
jgi:hypothetical protein